MLEGKRLDKSRLSWRNLKRLKTIRGDLAIHLKKSALGVSYQQLKEWLNLFRFGIAGLLIDLHLLFDEQLPCKIIRCAHSLDIRLVETHV